MDDHNFIFLLLRSVKVGDVRRQVRFFGMKGDLKWHSQVFKLSATEISYLKGFPVRAAILVIVPNASHTLTT